MTEQDPKPTRTDRAQQRAGRTMVIVGLAQIVTLGALGLMVWIYASQADVIGNLAGQLRAQQEQFDTCKDKPTGTPGCTEKVSEEPDQIVDKAKAPAVAGRPIPGPTGRPGKDGPQAAEVRAMIVTELARTQPRLTGAQVQQIARVAATLVPKPADGKSPTPAQIRPIVDVAVAVYCGQDRCAGRDGQNGNDGKDGQNGSSPTDQQLLALMRSSLEAFCGQESAPCRGPVGQSGADGKDGQKGDPGRSVKDMDCVGSGDESQWVITYSDDTTETVLGPCRLAPPGVLPLKVGN